VQIFEDGLLQAVEYIQALLQCLGGVVKIQLSIQAPLAIRRLKCGYGMVDLAVHRKNWRATPPSGAAARVGEAGKCHCGIVSPNVCLELSLRKQPVQHLLNPRRVVCSNWPHVG